MMPLILIVLAFFLRTFNLGNDLLIHYDQGRDLLAAYQIWHEGNLTLLGPATDVPGVFFGPLYYYLISIPLWVSGGHPVWAMVFLIILEMGCLGLLYLGTRKLFDKKVALASLALAAVSLGLVSHSRWLSNAMPAAMLGYLIIFILSRIDNIKYLYLYFLMLGLLFQFNPAQGIGLLFFGLYLLIKCKASVRQWAMSGAWFLLPGIPQILFELRHDFLITKGIFSGVIVATNQFSIKPLISFLSIVLANGSWTWLVVGLLIIESWKIVKLYKSDANFRLVSLFVLSQIFALLMFNRIIFEFFYLSIAGGVVVLLSKTTTPITWVLVGLNLWWSFQAFSSPSRALIPIGTANLVTLENRLTVASFVDTSEDYTLWTYDIPYFKDEVWEYIWLWKDKHQPTDSGQILYTIYERDWDRPHRFSEWLAEVDSKSNVQGRLVVENFTVEKRLWKQK